MSTRKGIGYSPLTEKVYLGRQNRAQGRWIGEKEDITSDFINIMLEYVPMNTSRTFGSSPDVNTDTLIHVGCDAERIKKVIKMLQKDLKELEGEDEESDDE